jgi:hypothetical protein
MSWNTLEGKLQSPRKSSNSSPSRSPTPCKWWPQPSTSRQSTQEEEFHQNPNETPVTRIRTLPPDQSQTSWRKHNASNRDRSGGAAGTSRNSKEIRGRRGGKGRWRWRGAGGWKREMSSSNHPIPPPSLASRDAQQIPAIGHKAHTGLQGQFLSSSLSIVSIMHWIKSQAKSWCFPSVCALQIALELKVQNIPFELSRLDCKKLALHGDKPSANLHAAELWRPRFLINLNSRSNSQPWSNLG